MSWEIQIERKAMKELKKISEPYKSGIIEAVNKLTEDARPPGCTRLKGADGLWRIRVNDYRIVYQIEDDKLMILVIRIGHRKDIYEGL